MRQSRIRDELLFYDLMEESNSIEELNDTIEYLTDCFRAAICDICDDKNWNYSDICADIM